LLDDGNTIRVVRLPQFTGCGKRKRLGDPKNSVKDRIFKRAFLVRALRTCLALNAVVGDTLSPITNSLRTLIFGQRNK
jgi:hypothetical protein